VLDVNIFAKLLVSLNFGITQIWLKLLSLLQSGKQMLCWLIVKLNSFLISGFEFYRTM